MKIVNGNDWILVSNKVRIERFYNKYSETLNNFEFGEDIFSQRVFKCKLKFNYLG